MTPLNYCRQATQDLKLAIQSRPDIAQAQLILQRIEESVKFILPMGGAIMDDLLYRAVAS